MQEKIYSLGIDIGSTTVKTVLRENELVIYEKYERHMAQVRRKTLSMLEEMRPLLEGCSTVTGTLLYAEISSPAKSAPSVRTPW